MKYKIIDSENRVRCIVSTIESAVDRVVEIRKIDLYNNRILEYRIEEIKQ